MDKYIPLHFDPCELLPGLTADLDWPSLDPKLRALLDDRLLETIDDIRGLLGVPCYVNDYAHGGKRVASGYRGPNCTVGALHSQHRLGRAADLHPDGMSADEARAKIVLALANGKLPYLGGVELGVPWLHVDVRPRHNGHALFFHP
jgi:uncharacterized protein YcbK (DUF882 family)